MQTSHIVKDPWLSGILGVETLRIELDETFVEELIKNKKTKESFQKRQQGHVFVYGKAPTMQLSWVRLLEELDFHLIDTNLTLEKPIFRGGDGAKSVSYEKATDGAWEIRFAEQGDEEGTVALAGSCFLYSRFHLDPVIPRERANAVKARWVGNFFHGQRGDFMVIALKNQKIAGFLQLLQRGKTLVIDLIGVGETHRRTGIGGMLIEYAEKHCGSFETMRVGTQVANVPSLSFYEKLGFRVVDSQYVFHYHGTDK